MMLPSTEKLIKALRKQSLPLEDRTALTSVLMDKIGVLPIEQVIATSVQGIQIRGRMLEKEQALSLKEGCVSLSQNGARALIREQVRYLAIVEGIHNGLTPEQILFSKTALWNMQMEDKIIEEIILQGVVING